MRGRTRQMIIIEAGDALNNNACQPREEVECGAVSLNRSQGGEDGATLFCSTYMPSLWVEEASLNRSQGGEEGQ